MTMEAHDIHFQFSSKLAELYQLQSSSDLRTWQTEAPATIGTDTDSTITTDRDPTHQRRFYRLTKTLR